MRQKNVKKKIGPLLLAAAMIITSFPASVTEVQAAELRSAAPGWFVTKEQLKTFNTDNSDGENPAKVYFGKNDGNNQEWWIAGSQGGDSVTLFAASPLATNQKFDSNYNSSDSSTQTKTYNADGGCKYSEGTNITIVNANHYGASTLRAALKGLETSCFSAAERALMQGTTIYTNDTRNKCAYSTTDKLYPAYEGTDGNYITVGENASNNLNSGLRIEKKYWRNQDSWLRAPSNSSRYNARAVWNSSVGSCNLANELAVVPAFELDLSSVLFASAAKAASTDSAKAETIADDAAMTMTLRLDASNEKINKKIGTASYDAAVGKIVAQKDKDAAGTVSLVVQGNDGTKDWYYSVPAGEGTVVTKEQIQAACSVSDLDLADCKIWLETTEDSVTYARMAEAKTIKTVGSIALTGVKPTGGSTFPANATCTTEGIASGSLGITYTAGGSSTKLTGNADWNKTYQAKITLALYNSGDTVYMYGDSVSVTVDGDTAQQFTPNTDGTLTVTKEFTTAKRKITGVTAPEVPSGTVFANYYTVDSILTSNSELGAQAELALEGSSSPNTVKKDVAWTLANSGGAAYNAAPGAANTFRWTVNASETGSYNASPCPGYDSKTGGITGTVTVTNKAATPVTIAGNDQTLTYDGSVIDVSQYFNIDENAGEAAYSLVSKEDDETVTGEGSLSGTALTVTKPGVFRVTLTTAAKGNYAAGEKTITVTVNYTSGVVTLAPGKTVVRADETIKNTNDGTVTIDKGNDGTVDVTVKLPSAGNVNVDANGRLTVPNGGKVLAAGGKELTLPNGGSVDKDGNVEAAKIVSGDTTVTAPSGGKVTADKAGNITVPAGGTVQSGDAELTLPEGGTVDADGTVTAGKVVNGETTATAPSGGKVTADTAGNITVPAGGTVQSGDAELTLPEGGTVDADGTVTAGKVVNGETTATAPSGGKVTADTAGNITVPAGGTVQSGDAELTLPEGGTVDADGTVTAGKIVNGDTTVTAPEGGSVTADKVGNITVLVGGKVQTKDGKELTLPDGGTVHKDGSVEAGKIVNGDTTVTAPEGGSITADKAGNIMVPAGGTVQSGDGEEQTLQYGGMVEKDGKVQAADKNGNIIIPAGGKVQTEDGKELTLPDGGTIDKDRNVEADKIVNGDITVTAPSGGKVTADKAGNITVPAGGKVQTGEGELALPDGGTVDKDGTVTAGKIVNGETTVTAPSGGKVTADKAGMITVSAGGTVETGDGKELTLPDGGIINKDGKIEAEKITAGDTIVTAPSGEKVTADKEGTITVPAGGTVETGDGKVTTLPSGGTVDKDGTVTAENGNIIIPAGGKVQTEDGKELTLPDGGTIDKDRNVEADKIVNGDITVTAPEGGKVTADKAGNITVPAEGKVQTGEGELALPDGGTVDKDGTVTAGKIVNGETTVTAPSGGKVTADKAGMITVSAGGTVETGDGKELTLPDGGIINKDGKIEAEKITAGDTIVTAPSGEKVTADKEGTITVPAGGTVETGDGKVTTLPSGGTVDKDGTVTAEKIVNGETTVTAPEGGSVTADKAGNITVPAGGKVQSGDGKELALPDGGTVDKDGTVTAGKIVNGDTTVTAPEGGKVTADKAGNITVPAEGKVQTGEGELALPDGGTVDKDGTVTAGKIVNGETTVMAPEGGSVTADKAGMITVSAGGTVETGDGKELTLPDGGIINKDGKIEAEKITAGDTTVTAPSGEKVTADKEGTITVPAGGTVETGDGKVTTLPSGGTVNKDGSVSANPTQPTNPPTESPATASPAIPTANPATASPAIPTENPPTASSAMPTNPLTNLPTIKPEVPDTGMTVPPEEVKKNSEKLDSGVSAGWKGNAFTLGWQAVQGAEGYDIFAARCGEEMDENSLIKTVKGNKTSVSLAKIAGKKLSDRKNYKVRIKAWKQIGGQKVYIGSSRGYHIAGRKHKKYTNAKKLIPAKKRYTLEKGKSAGLKVRIVKQSKKKKLLPNGHGPKLRYFSDNKEVATVTSKGRVRTKGKGTCYIYVTALNGIGVKIKITVK